METQITDEIEIESVHGFIFDDNTIHIAIHDVEDIVIEDQEWRERTTTEGGTYHVKHVTIKTLNGNHRIALFKNEG